MLIKEVVRCKKQWQAKKLTNMNKSNQVLIVQKLTIITNLRIKIQEEIKYEKSDS